MSTNNDNDDLDMSEEDGLCCITLEILIFRIVSIPVHVLTIALTVGFSPILGFIYICVEDFFGLFKNYYTTEFFGDY